MTLTARRRGGVLRQRNFFLLWTGETISGAGSSMATVGVPLLAVTVLHASTFAVAVLTGAAYLPWRSCLPRASGPPGTCPTGPAESET
jgi:hypothetical protein